MSNRRNSALAALAVAFAFGAGFVLFGGASDDEPEAVATTTTLPITTSSAPATTTVPTTPPRLVVQALSTSIDLYAAETDAAPTRVLTAAEATSAPGIPIVFLAVEDVVAPEATRVQVHLPIRPNGSVGWVEVADVSIAPVTFRIEVDITAHLLRLYDSDELVLEEPIGVGREDRPTPGGIYYIKELLQPPSPNGAYGVYAYGLSGFSNVLTSFNGGQGVIGIHGTNEPELLGTDVSSGCIRMHNDTITRLVQEIGLPLGTPVEILA